MITTKNTSFSNMHVMRVPFEYQGILYHSTENFYQAMKSTDHDIRRQIAAMNPYESKKAGKTVKLRPDWDEIKLKVMAYAIKRKFGLSPYKEALIRTGSQEIVEVNTWNDTFWGVCKGVGHNHLGRILMDFRAELGATK